MKGHSIIFSVFILLFVSFSCSKDALVASDEITTKKYSFSDFTALEVHDNFKVFLSFSDTEEKFEVEANENLHRYIKISQTGNEIIVKLDGVNTIIGNETLNIHITTKKITDIKLKGNTNLEVENLVSSANVEIDLTGNCFFTGTVNVGQMNLNSTGNCIVDMSGNVGLLDAELTGNSELSDYSLTVEDLKLTLSGNSNAHLNVTNSISMDGSGNSILFYEGDASVIHQNLSSNSKIIKI